MRASRGLIVYLFGVSLCAVALATWSQETPGGSSAVDHMSASKHHNLQVLPGDVSVPIPVRTMKRYERDLGVTCAYCHVEDRGTGKFDYASDENPKKETTRIMIAMLDDINERHLGADGRGPALRCGGHLRQLPPGPRQSAGVGGQAPMTVGPDIPRGNGKRWPTALAATLAIVSGVVLLAPADAQIAVRNQGYIPYDDAPIHYRSENIDDPVSVLQRKLEAGKARLVHDGSAHGYLESVLTQLDIPVSSQTLVFSKTSFQYPHISPEHPRALYFNDDVYIGVVNEG
ncbi:c-type cytochrome [Pseudoxanthomonas sp. NC8]|nr:c-type cytochrome [Pseudoxanthomonas sp. NC8]